MDLSELKRRMRNFSIESLKTYLGHSILDTLIEWTPQYETLLTKSKLSEMILTIHGIKILKAKKFRNELIKTSFSNNEIESFKQFLKGISEDSTDLQIVNLISNRLWKGDRVNYHFLKLLKIYEDLFARSDDKNKTEDTVSAYDRFYELLDYQFLIKHQILRNLTSGDVLTRMIVHMPTGTGKTKTAVHTICHHYNFNLKKKGLVIWIAHTTELLEQAYGTFYSSWKHLGDGEINLYRLWGTHSPSPEASYNGIMFCGIQKLMNLSQSDPELMQKLINHSRLIVFDEAHKASAGETRKVIEELMIKKPHMCDRALIGLTATPGRSTEEDPDNEFLTAMFENRIININIETLNKINLSEIDAINASAETDLISYFQRNRVLAKIIKEPLTYPESLSPNELEKIKTDIIDRGYRDTDFTEKALETIGKNKSRNLAIMERLRKLNKGEVPTIVFACNVKHGQLLSSMLSIDNIPNALVIGDMPSKERDEAIKAFKDKNNPIKILINFDVLTTGFDSTNIRCVFITRPTQSVVRYSQMIGRGLRGPKMGGNEECLLIDVKDNLEKYDEKLAFKHFDNYWRS